MSILTSHSIHRSRLTSYWLWGALFLVFCIIVVGGVTRLTHSGLSMVEWKPIMGILPPLNEIDWQIAFDKYKQFPEYQQINMGMPLSNFKFIFFMEYFHRLLGRLIGLFFFLPFVIQLGRGKLPPTFKKAGFIALFLGALQGGLGWYMVKSGLSLEPSVSHYRLAAHLLMALLIGGVIIWMLCKHYEVKQVKVRSPHLIHIAMTFLVLTVLYGAFVAGLKAGLIYNTYPLMNGEFIPGEWMDLTPWYSNLFENHGTVQFIHRNLAHLTFVLIAFTAFKIRRKETKIWSFLALIQVILGIKTLLFQVPVSLGTLHQAWAVVVYAYGIYLMMKFKRG